LKYYYSDVTKKHADYSKAVNNIFTWYLWRTSRLAFIEQTDLDTIGLCLIDDLDTIAAIGDLVYCSSQ